MDYYVGNRSDLLIHTKASGLPQEVIDKIKGGTRMHQLIQDHPGQVFRIPRFMCLRPDNQHKTKCLYIWGATGAGITSTVQTTL